MEKQDTEGKRPEQSRFYNTQMEDFARCEVICECQDCKFNMANKTGLGVLTCELKQIIIAKNGCVRFEKET